MIVIGLTGTLGAGKGTVAEYLVERKKFIHFSVRSFIEREMTRRKLPINRDTITETANNIRKEHSPSFIVEELYKEANEAITAGANSIIESIRTPGEVSFLKTKGNFYLLAVDADPKIRYERIYRRASTTDEVTFEKFLSDEKREMSSEDPSKQNISRCIELADFKVSNDGTQEELYAQIDKILKNIEV
jgi:dephospho-CoA kinase